MSNEAAELSAEEWKQRKKEKKAQMAAMQALPYEVKVKRAELRARMKHWVEGKEGEADGKDKNYKKTPG